MATAIKNPLRTKKFKGLVVALGSEEAAVKAWNNAFPDNAIPVETEVPDNVAALVAAGFSEEEARKLLDAQGASETVALTSQEEAEVLIAKSGLTPVRGRVYINSDVVDAFQRVLKTGKPEVIKTPGSHRTKAVALWKADDNVACQNLGEVN
jgi:hypothetical protein